MGPWLLVAVGVTAASVKWENSTKNKNFRGKKTRSWSILWLLSLKALSACQDCPTQGLGVKQNCLMPKSSLTHSIYSYFLLLAAFNLVFNLQNSLWLQLSLAETWAPFSALQRCKLHPQRVFGGKLSDVLTDWGRSALQNRGKHNFKHASIPAAPRSNPPTGETSRWDCSFLTIVSFALKIDVQVQVLFPCASFLSFRSSRWSNISFSAFPHFPFHDLLYRQLGKRLPYKKRGSVHGSAAASRNSQWSQIGLYAQLGKYFPANPAEILVSWRKVSWYYTDRPYKGECSSLGSLLQSCSHISLVSSLLPYFEDVHPYLVFLQNELWSDRIEVEFGSKMLI